VISRTQGRPEDQVKHRRKSSAAAGLAAARQLGSALGWGTSVAVPGDRTAAGRVGFNRAWIVVPITAAITAFPGLAVGRR
jgi:hypothetical protein